MSTKFEIAAFFERFPFLLASTTRGVEHVEVKRVDIGLLECTPKFEGATGAMVDIQDSDEILLLNAAGELLAEVAQGGRCVHNEAYTDDEELDGETVGEALLRIDPAAVAYIVRHHTGFEIQDHESVGGNELTVYLPGVDMEKWLAGKLQTAREKLSGEVESLPD